MRKAKPAQLIETTKVKVTQNLDLNAMTLLEFLSQNNKALDMTYVQDSFGNTFTRVSLVSEKLTDGSIVNNLVLS